MAATDETPLLATPLVAVHDLAGPLGGAPQASACLLFTYRGALCLRTPGRVTIADPGQAVLLDAGAAYPCEASGPTTAGSLRIQVDAALLRELAAPGMLADGEPLRFAVARLPIDPRAQALVALLRQGLRAGIADALEGESLALTLVQRAIGPRTARTPGSTRAAQRLVDRAKLVLAADRAFAAALDALDTTSPFPAAWLHFARGVLWAERAGDPGRGEQHYRRAVAVLPQFVLAQVHLAEREVARDRIAPALERISVVAHGSTDPEIDVLLGTLLRRCGHGEASRGRFRRALRRYAWRERELPGAFADHVEAVERAARSAAPDGIREPPPGCARLDLGGG